MTTAFLSCRSLSHAPNPVVSKAAPARLIGSGLFTSSMKFATGRDRDRQLGFPRATAKHHIGSYFGPCLWRPLPLPTIQDLIVSRG